MKLSTIIQFTAIIALAATFATGDEIITLSKPSVTAPATVNLPESHRHQAIPGTEQYVDFDTRVLVDETTTSVRMWLGRQAGFKVFHRTDLSQDVNGVITWNGLSADGSSNVTIALRNKAFYAVASVDEETWVVQRGIDSPLAILYNRADAEVLLPEEKEDDLVPEELENERITLAAPAAKVQKDNGEVAIVDILVAHSRTFGKYDDPELIIANEIAATNQAYRNSGALIELRLVGTVKVNYADSSNLYQTLTDLRKGTGPFAIVHTQRDKKGADLVAYVQNYAGGSTGLAYRMPKASKSFKDYAFSVSVLPSSYTMAHEIGHNFGLNHNEDDHALYNYAVGHRFPEKNQRYRTIMSYTPGVRIQHFSNPQVEYSGYTTGNHKADSVKALNAVRHLVADFRSNKLNVKPRAVSADLIEKANGEFTLEAVFEDADAIYDMEELYILVNRNGSKANAFYLLYNQTKGFVALRNDKNTAWKKAKVGSSARPGNPQGSIDMSGFKVEREGKQLTVSIPVRFKPTFNGNKKIFLKAVDRGNKTSGLKKMQEIVLE